MKRIAMLALSVLLITISAQAQVYLTNTFDAALEVGAQGKKTVLNPGQEALIHFIDAGSTAKLFCRVEHDGKIKSFKVEKKIEGNKLAIGPSDLTGNDKPQSEIAKTVNEEYAPYEAQVPTGQKQLVNIKNTSKNRFSVQSNGPFKGISLASGDESANIELAPGLYQFTALVDRDNDSSSTGRNFSQAVIKFILVQDQHQVVITENNISEISDDMVKIKVRSSFPHKIVFVGTTLGGRAIKDNSFLRGKADLKIGFNSLSIQFFQQGIKYQADVEFIIAEGERVITLGRNNLRNIIKIEGGYSTF
ncbi:MAG: hypothetical protein PHE20_04505 [Patescibacteria group bacterium]|nr:hypothetical protein [Patescibacteria group bacterium]